MLSTDVLGHFCSRGYAEAEIEAVFAKYDLDGDRRLNEEEQRKMNLALDREREALERDIDREKVRPKSAQSTIDSDEVRCSIISLISIRPVRRNFLIRVASVLSSLSFVATGGRRQRHQVQSRHTWRRQRCFLRGVHSSVAQG